MSFNLIPEDVDLEFLLEEFKKDLMRQFNCHAVGEIESFDSSNQTARVNIAYKKTYVRILENGRQEEELVEYPVLIDCPVIVLKGGGFSLKMPIQKGDECLILFNDRSIDQWFATRSNKRLDSNRLHSLSDGIILVGLSSLHNSLSGYQNNKVVLGDGTHNLELGGGESTLKNGSTEVSVGQLVSIKSNTTNLKIILENIITATSSAQGANAALLTQTRTLIGQLLE